MSTLHPVHTAKSMCTTTGQQIAFAIFVAVLRAASPAVKFTSVQFDRSLWNAYVEAIRLEARHTVRWIAQPERHEYLEQMVEFVRVIQSYYGRELTQQTMMELEALLPAETICVWDDRLDHCDHCLVRPAFFNWRGMFICDMCRWAVAEGMIDPRSVPHACNDCGIAKATPGKSRCEACEYSLQHEVDKAISDMTKRRAAENQVLLRLLIEEQHPWWTFNPLLVNIFNQGVYSVIDRVRAFGKMTGDLCAGLLDSILDDRRLFASPVTAGQLKGGYFGRRNTDARRSIPVGG